MYAPKQFVFYEGGRIEVRANSVAELRVALKELSLLKREFRLQKQELAARLRSMRPTIRKAVRLGVSVPGVDGVSAPIEANELQEMLGSAEEGLQAFDGIIRKTEEIAIQVQAIILKNGG